MCGKTSGFVLLSLMLMSSLVALCRDDSLGLRTAGIHSGLTGFNAARRWLVLTAATSIGYFYLAKSERMQSGAAAPSRHREDGFIRPNVRSSRVNGDGISGRGRRPALCGGFWQSHLAATTGTYSCTAAFRRCDALHSCLWLTRAVTHGFFFYRNITNPWRVISVFMDPPPPTHPQSVSV